MPDLFQLPCPQCAAIIQVGPRQSGQTLTCAECGKDIEVPKLGEIKKLSPVETAPANLKRPMSAARKGLFTAGLALAVIFGGAGLGLHLYARSLHTPVDIEHHVQQTREEVRNLNPEQLYKLATTLSKTEDLGEFAEPPFLKGNKQSSILAYLAFGLYAIGGVGLLMLLGSFLMK